MHVSLVRYTVKGKYILLIVTVLKYIKLYLAESKKTWQRARLVLFTLSTWAHIWRIFQESYHASCLFCNKISHFTPKTSYFHQISLHHCRWNHDAMAKTNKQERWHHNKSECHINARGFTGALNDYSFGLLGYLYSVNVRGSCRIN